MSSSAANPAPPAILVADDDAPFRDSLKGSLEAEGYQVMAVATAAEALQALAAGYFDILLCDLRMPGEDGLALIAQVKQLAPQTQAVMMTAYGDVEVARRAIRAGAYDYIAKPFTGEELILTLKKLEERRHLLNENAELKGALNQKFSFANIIAGSRPMLEIFETVKRLSGFNTTVLITGESGTGKELLARAVHYNSPRRGKPFVAINCGAIPETLMESELFGHKKGAFTDATRDKKGLLEEASGGTVFLDEIGEMPAHLQVKLLRALQEQKIRRVGDEELRDIDTRLITATLRDLEEDVKSGRFREDLYYRLNVVSIHIPPLRERLEDISLLVQHFLKKHSKRLGKAAASVEPDVMKVLLQYRWPGNVRELENCIERAMVLTAGSKIEISSLPPAVMAGYAPAAQTPGHVALQDIPEDNLSIKQRTSALEVGLINKALQRTGGNRTRAAKLLEISHRALLYKLKEYGII